MVAGGAVGVGNNYNRALPTYSRAMPRGVRSQTGCGADSEKTGTSPANWQPTATAPSVRFHTSGGCPVAQRLLSSFRIVWEIELFMSFINNQKDIVRLAALLGVLLLASQNLARAACPSCLANLNLPSSVSVTYLDGDANSYLKDNLSGIAAGSDIGNQVYAAWCLQQNVPAIANVQYAAVPYSSYRAPLPAPWTTKPWDQINYILNHEAQYYATNPATFQMQFQKALWVLLGYDGYYNASKDLLAKSILADASANGVGFVPGPGQVVGVILDLNNVQDTLIEVPVPVFGSIGDFVWLDTNHNGVQDAGEPGINGVTVRLTDALGNTTSAVTATNGTTDGYYQFTGLSAGTYTVTVDTSSAPLLGLLASPTGAGTAATDSNPNPSAVVLADRESNQTIDFGFMTLCTGQIGDLVWNDYNRNGIQDAGEPGISGATVNLHDSTGFTLLKTTTSGANGSYNFSGVCAGTYRVAVDQSTLPAGFTPTVASAPGSNLLTDSNGSPSLVTLPADNSIDTSIDFGYLQPCAGQVGFSVWHDLNRDGLQTGGEPGIDGVSLTLTDSQGNQVASALTTLNGSTHGYYQFNGVCAGTYSAAVTGGIPAGWTPTIANAGSDTTLNSRTSPASVTLATPAAVDETINFGYVSPCVGKIGYLVWNDADQNGLFSGSEAGIPNAVVNLRRPSDNTLIQTTTTDGGGDYHFTGLCLGDYKVEVAPPATFLPTAVVPGGNVGSPFVASLPADDTGNETVNFGFYQPVGSIAGVVYTDINSNLLYDAGTDAPLAGVTVTLTGTDINGQAVSRTAVSAADGNYQFTGLLQGNYSVSAPTPAKGEALETAAKLDATLAAGQNATNQNFGYVTGSIAGTVFSDNNKNGSLDGGDAPIAGVTVTLSGTDYNGNPVWKTTVTASNGTYSFPGLLAGNYQVSTPATAAAESLETPSPITVPLSAGQSSTGNNLGYVTGSIAGTVYTDSNASGTLDAGEPDMVGVTVTLTDCSGNPVATTITSIGGTYLFSNLTAGCYRVSSTAAVNGENLETPSPLTVNLTAGQSSTGNNFGYVFPALTLACVTNSDQVGVAYSSSLVAAGGTGVGYTYSISAGSLPGGLTLNPTSGALTGTPTAAGSFSFTAKVVDSRGNAAGTTTNACGVTITPPPVAPLGLACPTATGQVGVAYNSTPAVTGGLGPYNYTVVAGALPTGLSINASTGAITGTPTATGNFGFSIKVTDSLGSTAISACSPSCVSVASTWNLNSPLGPLGTSQVYSANGLTVTAYGYANSGPARVLYGRNDANNESGIGISGTTENEIDGNNFVQLDLSAVIAAGAQNGTMMVDSVQNGESFNIYGSNTPGSIGTLLAGSLTANGVAFPIPGFPAYKYVGVRAASGNVLVRAVSFTFGTCSIAIAAPVDLQCGSCGSSKATLGKPYSSTLLASGGTGPYTFAVQAGSSLPPGVSLDATAGVISGTPTKAGTYIFTTVATDAKGAPATATCTISVVTVPVDLECGSCGTGRGTVGKAYSSTLTATGGSGGFTYSLNSGSSLPPGLSLNASTGAIAGTPTTPGTYTFTTVAQDSSGNTDKATCTIWIVPSPVNLDCGSCGAGRAVAGTAYSSSLSVTGSSGSLTFSIISGSLPAGLSLNTTTGKISGTPTTPGTYTFTSKVVDGNGNSDSQTCTIVVAGLPVDLDCGACGSGGSSGGKVGSPYSSTVAVSGGKAPFTFSIVSGSLPAGTMLNSSTGVISGTPTASGTFTFTAKVSDANGSTDTVTCSITVIGSPVDLDCGACGGGKATVGVAYSAAFTVTGGSSPFAYSIKSGSLPPGLSLSSSTGKITGTPTTAGTYTFTAQVKDSHGNTDTASCTISVVATQIDLRCGSCGASGSATVGAAYSSGLAVTGGTGPFSYSVSAGSLPPGLSLNASTGVISGTSTTAGTYTFTSMVRDSKGSTDTAICTVIVASAPLDLECGICGNARATLGTPYSSSLSASGGTGTLTFSVQSGALPPGLSLNASTGGIAGTPTAAGTFTFTSLVKDSKGKTDTATCTLVVVGAPITLSCGPCSAGKATTGTPYSAAMIVTNSAGGNTFAVISGSLPPGLAINASTGVISGTPTSPGVYTFTAKVTDSKGNSDSDVCTIYVVAPSLDLACGTCGAGTARVGVAYATTLSVTGGAGPYLYSIASGALPPGLALNGVTGKISGTPTKTGQYVFTSKVVDSTGASDTATCVVIVKDACGWD